MKKALLILLAIAVLGASRPVQVVISPSRPTIGDLITVTFPPDVQRVFLAPGTGYEVVRSERNQVVVRSFRPGRLSLDGRLVRKTGDTQLSLEIPFHSVLQPNDALEPAPLRPPRPLPPNQAARIAIATAAAVAFLSWLATFLLARRRQEAAPSQLLAPVQEFREALARAARTRDANLRLIQLAAATRIYLARAREDLGTELTTFEMAHRLRPEDARSTILELLTAADLAKFSPWGPETRDYAYLMERLARLPDTFETSTVAA